MCIRQRLTFPFFAAYILDLQIPARSANVVFGILATLAGTVAHTPFITGCVRRTKPQIAPKENSVKKPLIISTHHRQTGTPVKKEPVVKKLHTGGND